MTACAFCGSTTKLTKEHLLPDWLSRELDTAGGGDAGTYRRSAAGGRRYDEWESRGFSLTARIACAGCNNGWMSRLEKAARPHLRQPIRGADTPVDIFVQPLLAAWVYKTALVHAATDPNRVMWLEAYHEFGDWQLPPESTQIWLGSVDRERGQVIARFNGRWSEHVLDGRSGGTAESYQATFTIGRAVFVVMEARDVAETRRVPIDLSFTDAADSHFKRIWPVTYSFTWSGEPALDEQTLRATLGNVPWGNSGPAAQA